MIFETLVVVDGWLNGYLLAEEESIAYLHARHEIVVATSMSQLNARTKVETVLLYIESSLCTYREIVFHAILTRMGILCLTE